MIGKQTNEYNCGPTALSYFLALHGHNFDVETLGMCLDPSPELGTDPKAIEDFLDQMNISFTIKECPVSTPFKKHKLPILVNINYENDGDHYMVAIESDADSNLTLWDPYTAELRYYSWSDFKNNWYSPLKKLKNWCLYLT